MRGWTMVAAMLGIASLVAGGCGGSDAGVDLTDVLEMPAGSDVIDAEDDTLPPDAAPDTVMPDDAQIPLEVMADGAEELPPTDATNYVILTTEELFGAAEAFAAYRQGQGYRTAIYQYSDLAGSSTSAKVATMRAEVAALRAALPQGYPLFVLLLGEARDGSLPSTSCDNMLGGCRTDSDYVDIDQDGLPDAAIGRVPARNETEALAYLDKVQTHESTYTVGVHNRRIGVYTGRANFSPAVDAMLEGAVMEALKRVSHLFDITGLYNNATSDYYYTPFDDKVADLFNEGAFMMLYIGHGTTGWTEGLEPDQLDDIHCSLRLPLMFFFACYNGNYTDAEPSLAEQLIFKADGTITAVGSSDVSHPYGNAILAYETQRVFLDERLPTVGEGFLATRRAMVERTDEFRDMIDGVSTVEVPKAEQAQVRREHVNLYNLFGDPACQVRYPQGLATLNKTSGSAAERTITVSGETSGLASGSALVTLEVERDQIIGALAPVDPQNPDEATVQANWAKANNKVVVGATVPVTAGAFEVTLDFPDGLPGNRGWVKVYAWEGNQDRFGMLEIAP